MSDSYNIVVKTYFFHVSSNKTKKECEVQVADIFTEQMRSHSQ